jgi:hypothetical protein
VQGASSGDPEQAVHHHNVSASDVTLMQWRTSGAVQLIHFDTSRTGSTIDMSFKNAIFW